MKKNTIIKILKRYEKSLLVMAKEAENQGEKADAEHYIMDAKAFTEVLKNMERNNI